MWITARSEMKPFRTQRPRYSSRQDENAIMAAVARALSDEDMEYLKSQRFDTSDLRRYARERRKQFVAAYLDQCRESFQRSAHVAREFAADSDAPELAFAVLRKTIRFHVLWATLRLSLAFHLTGPVQRLTETLSEMAARTTAATPQGAAPDLAS